MVTWCLTLEFGLKAGHYSDIQKSLEDHTGSRAPLVDTDIPRSYSHRNTITRRFYGLSVKKGSVTMTARWHLAIAPGTPMSSPARVAGAVSNAVDGED